MNAEGDGRGVVVGAVLTLLRGAYENHENPELG